MNGEFVVLAQRKNGNRGCRCWPVQSCAVVAALALLASPALAQPSREQKLPPTQADVPYGPHERHRLDFWAAESAGPRPLVIYIHGGGFRNGSKESVNQRTLRGLLDAGISVAALNYRLTGHAPLPAAHDDCRRALQFLRSQADEWNIDPQRVGAFGGSAGAQLCMWLAFHDDMADPQSDDPLEGQSTKLQAVATSGGQTTMDFAWWHEHIPDYQTPHRPPTDYFGDAGEEEQQRIVRDISALDLLSSDDPPIYMNYNMTPDDPVPGEGENAVGWKVHHVNFGVQLAQLADRLGVEAYLNYPGKKTKYPSNVEFFIDVLASPAE